MRLKPCTALVISLPLWNLPTISFLKPLSWLVWHRAFNLLKCEQLTSWHFLLQLQITLIFPSHWLLMNVWCQLGLVRCYASLLMKNITFREFARQSRVLNLTCFIPHQVLYYRKENSARTEKISWLSPWKMFCEQKPVFWVQAILFLSTIVDNES